MERNIFLRVNYELPLCSICFGECVSAASAIECGHIFHTECIVGWIKRDAMGSKKCPLCRTLSLKDPLELKLNIRKDEVDESEKFLELMKVEDKDSTGKLLIANAHLCEKNCQLQKEIDKIRADFEKQGEEVRDKNKEIEELLLKLEASTETENEALRKAKLSEVKALQAQRQFDHQKDFLVKMEAELFELRKLKGIIDNGEPQEEEVLRLARNHYPLDQQASLFFETVLMKKAEIARLNKQVRRGESEIEEFKKRLVLVRRELEEKDSENKKLREELKSLKKVSQVSAKEKSSSQAPKKPEEGVMLKTEESSRLTSTPKPSEVPLPVTSVPLKVIPMKETVVEPSASMTFGRSLDFNRKRVNKPM